MGIGTGVGMGLGFFGTKGLGTGHDNNLNLTIYREHHATGHIYKITLRLPINISWRYGQRMNLQGDLTLLLSLVNFWCRVWPIEQGSQFYLGHPVRLVNMSMSLYKRP